MAGDWITNQEKIVVDSPFVQVIERDCRSSEDGRTHRFYLLKSRDWCNIIPITEDGKVVCVKQYRIGVSAHTLEIPGGVVDLNETPMDSAMRELQEETGYTPLPGVQCVDLGWNHPNPAIQDNRCHSFVIGPVKKTVSQKLDYGEMIEVVEIPLQEIPKLIQDGAITHALMLQTFFKLGLQTQNGVQALIEGMNSMKTRKI